MDKLIADLKQKMDKAIQILSQDLGTIRAGRASASLVENVRVKVYGGSTELTVAELASITASDSKTLIITPFDVSIIEELERGLMQVNLGVTFARDGEIIRVIIPPLTSERREEFVKLAKTKTEGVKVMIRQIRQEGMNRVRDQFAAKEIAEDQKFRMEKDIQKETDGKIEQADSLLESKVKELTTV
jgi:ribosome recycling factor